MVFKYVRCWYPGFEGGQAQPDPDGGLVGVHHRVVVDVAMVADSDWLVVVLVDTVERVDWLCGRKRGGFRLVRCDWRLATDLEFFYYYYYYRQDISAIGKTV